MNFVFSFIDFHDISCPPFRLWFSSQRYFLSFYFLWHYFGCLLVWSVCEWVRCDPWKLLAEVLNFFIPFQFPFLKKMSIYVSVFWHFSFPKRLFVFFSIEDDDAVLRTTHSESARDRGNGGDTYHTVFEWLWWWDWQEWLLLLCVDGSLTTPVERFLLCFSQFNLFCVSFWRALLCAPGTYCLKL